MKITTESSFETITTEFKNSDVCLEQLYNAFKSHLIALTWTEKQINDYIIQLAKELK